ncbi:MAG: Maf family protein [Chloroflexota bacterium]|nr:Maf family protein [Chloroflexota bacterium]
MCTWENSERIPLVLASGSPRRRRLLSVMGLSFQTTVPAIDESAGEGEKPEALARRLSLLKARAAAEAYADAIIIAADTLVVCGGSVLGKPADASEAREMLVMLRGRQHRVLSGVALYDATRRRQSVQIVKTMVYMRDYTEAEIRRYVASGEPMDKAGAYAIQDQDFSPVARIDGCYTNVVGLPLCHLYRMLADWDIEIPIRPLTCCPLAVGAGCSLAERL